jgi:hypothetical protein
MLQHLMFLLAQEALQPVAAETKVQTEAPLVLEQPCQQVLVAAAVEPETIDQAETAAPAEVPLVDLL